MTMDLLIGKLALSRGGRRFAIVSHESPVDSLPLSFPTLVSCLFQVPSSYRFAIHPGRLETDIISVHGFCEYVGVLNGVMDSEDSGRNRCESSSLSSLLMLVSSSSSSSSSSSAPSDSSSSSS